MRRVPYDGAAPRPGELLELPEENAHYVVNVLRCQPGEELELFDGDGNAWLAELVETSPARVEVVKRLDRSAAESPCQITLFQAVPKRDRFEWLLEKATELGVDAIVPIESARSVVRIPSDRVDKKLKRWRKIVTSAARQSQRAVVPEVASPRTFAQALEGVDGATHLYLQPDAGSSVAGVVRGADRVGVWVGPEGGFTAEETERLDEFAVGVGIGPRILRSETAGIVSVALVQEHTGGLAP